MTVRDLGEAAGFTLLCGDGDRVLSGEVYCGDLLSVVMGRAPAGCVWVTVMGNVNSVAVAVLTDAACIVLAEGMPLAADALLRAEGKGIPVLGTGLPVFQAAMAAAGALGR